MTTDITLWQMFDDILTRREEFIVIVIVAVHATPKVRMGNIKSGR